MKRYILHKTYVCPERNVYYPSSKPYLEHELPKSIYAKEGYVTEVQENDKVKVTNIATAIEKEEKLKMTDYSRTEQTDMTPKVERVEVVKAGENTDNTIIIMKDGLPTRVRTIEEPSIKINQAFDATGNNVQVTTVDVEPIVDMGKQPKIMPTTKKQPVIQEQSLNVFDGDLNSGESMFKEELITSNNQPININSADFESLVSIKGIGRGVAAKILDGRKEKPFESLAQLQEIAPLNFGRTWQDLAKQINF